MIARDVMTARVLSVAADTTLLQIAKILVENSIGGVPVVDSEGLLVGMVGESDLIAPDAKAERLAGRECWLTRFAEGESLSPQFLALLDRSERVARDVMASPVVTVTENTALSEIARLFSCHGLRRLPVVRDGRMVGIVSRSDLVRQMARESAEPPHPSQGEGRVAEAVADVDRHFGQSHPSPTSGASPAEVPTEEAMSAVSFRALADDFGDQKVHRHDQEKRVAAERNRDAVKNMLGRHLEDEAWGKLLRRARAAAAAGEKALELSRFPSELCSDGGRAINTTQPDWPETLRGEPAEIYLRWERELKPKGFHLLAQVLDFPGGIPGDIGLMLVWGGGQGLEERQGSTTR